MTIDLPTLKKSSAMMMRILDEEFLPSVIPFMLHPEDHFHGLAHSRETAILACVLSMKEGVAPLAPMMTVCLHDTGRRDNDESQKHAHDGAKIAEMFFLYSSLGPHFSVENQAEIIEAIYYHADPAQATSQVGAYLQDADRLRLAWVSGTRSESFSTETGLQFAQAGRRLTMQAMEGLCAVDYKTTQLFLGDSYGNY